MVEPRNPFEGCQFHGFQGPPGYAAVDDFGLLEPVDCLGQRVVVAVALAADRGLDAGLGQPLALADRDVLRTTIPATTSQSIRSRTSKWIGLVTSFYSNALSTI